MTDIANVQVFSDHHLPVGEAGETVTVTVLSGDTVYYGYRQCSAAHNDGSLTVGQSTTVTAGEIWLISASNSEVQLYGVPPVPGSAGVAVGSAVGGGTASSLLVTDASSKVAAGPLTSAVVNDSSLPYIVGARHGIVADGSTPNDTALANIITTYGPYVHVELPPGTCFFASSITLPNPGQVTLCGQSSHTTTLKWGTDLGAGTYAITVASRSGGGCFHRIEKLALWGPGGYDLGVSNCNMDAIGLNSRGSAVDVSITGFRAGINRYGDHQAYVRVVSTNNVYGEYVAVSPASGDVIHQDCDFTGNNIASIAVDSQNRMDGDRYIGTHLGFSPYAITDVNTGGTLDGWMLIDVLFIGCGFEAVGNNAIYSSTGKIVTGCVFDKCGASWDSDYKYGTPYQDSFVKLTGGSFNHNTLRGHSTLALVGSSYFIDAADVSGCSFHDADELITAVVGAAVPFSSGMGGSAELRAASYSGSILQAQDNNGALAPHNLAGANTGHTVNNYAGANWSLPLGVVLTKSTASNQGVAVCTKGYASVLVGSVGVSTYDILTNDPSITNAVRTGSAGSSPIFGWATGGAAASGVLSSIYVRVQWGAGAVTTIDGGASA
jgi:hypothetical protein